MFWESMPISPRFVLGSITTQSSKSDNCICFKSIIFRVPFPKSLHITILFTFFEGFSVAVFFFFSPQQSEQQPVNVCQHMIGYKKSLHNVHKYIVQELCESRGGRPGLSVLTSLLVSVDVKIYCTVLRHWSQLVPNMSHDI